MKHLFLTLIATLALISCNNERLHPYDIAQKPAEVNIKGYAKPDSVQMNLNGQPVLINSKQTYAGQIVTKLNFVVDEGETNMLTVHRKKDGKQLAKYEINYNNVEDFKTLNFFSLPEIFLQAYAVKPQVNLGKVGFEFIFPNLGELSGSNLENVKGVLRRENGVVLATFDNIGKKEFTPVKIYNFFSMTAPVYLDLYKPGTTEPYNGSQPISVQIKQDIGANLIVLLETLENGQVVVKGDIDVADYL